MRPRSARRIKHRRPMYAIVALIGALALVVGACNGDDGESSTAIGGSAAEVIAARGLSEADVAAAVKTYMPSGTWDDYVMFSSGGHGGQVFVIGVPSMRLLKIIGVFTPEPWQGWGYGNEATMEVLEDGFVDGNPVLWADTHHPALSETNGEYDGEFLFINDKANARVAVIDLRDMETKQIIKNPVAINDHGGTKVTPNTEWVIEGGQYATPHGWEFSTLDTYAEEYRGMVTFWKFDRAAGRIDHASSFAMEMPPYWQDLCDAGKLVSEGWVVCGSFNTELASGSEADPQGKSFESGASARDNDYLHLIDLDKAAAVAAAGNTFDVNGFPVIGLDTSIAEGLLYFMPEPKSPHGADITPNGEFVVVSGKLDPHVTIYSFEKMEAAIAAQNWVPDAYGVPVLDFDSVVEAQVEVGLGPLHTEFDDKGYAYTSLFLEPSVARWSLGGDDYFGDDGWELVGKIPVQYNIGHLVTTEGDTVSPDGNWLVALNKWSIDRFLPPGPLLPQNFQLIDISAEPTPESETGGMVMTYDMPIGMGEPHYAQIIAWDKLADHVWEVYPEVGWDPATMSVDPDAPKSEADARVVRNGDEVEIFMTAVRSHYTPDSVTVKAGDRVTWHITNLDTSKDATHGIAVPGYNINLSLEPGETATMEFVANQDGVFPFYCTEFCSALHLEMAGYFLVEP